MEAALDLIRHTLTSPWVYLLLIGLTAVDAIFPLVPAEAAVITVTVLATGGEPNVVLVVLAAMLGATIGDHVSYAIGRGGGSGRLDRSPEDSRRRAGSQWARRAVDQRGGMILTAARYIPGGRTAVTLTMGAVRYPLRSFLLYDLIGTTSWALYCVLLGTVGGLAFQRDPLRGILAGVGLSIAVTALLELGRRLRHRAHRRSVRRD
ncbi:membrane protein DedA, SNARE-associated domain [Micromonospora phaseoli]|uniref:Membrane protein DedA, SNARE-associated domain n=1 Tax=Micromonospora phaseoli TaxID=1144548 RepID=A0A1H7BN35_9ACTN|nr:DedA family protein [Micromonospora phaseoli]PZV94913.1 membrane protein DedA with SNARE-associated domain [Micromonospora phaseoli]GIJ79758.1 membrane protein [Micromonospora phaseoli]SEJ77747.1 membrane protein DedA, SNARE-associated domain [Micromonospora phaseoli]